MTLKISGPIANSTSVILISFHFLVHRFQLTAFHCFHRNHQCFLSVPIKKISFQNGLSEKNQSKVLWLFLSSLYVAKKMAKKFRYRHFFFSPRSTVLVQAEVTLSPFLKANWPHRQTFLLWRRAVSDALAELQGDLSAPCNYSKLSVTITCFCYQLRAELKQLSM